MDVAEARSSISAAMGNCADFEATTDVGLRPLHVAATDIARLLLDRGEVVDARTLGGTTPLTFACQKRHVEMI